jgi:hypothetical protein
MGYIYKVNTYGYKVDWWDWQSFHSRLEAVFNHIWKIVPVFWPLIHFVFCRGSFRDCCILWGVPVVEDGVATYRCLFLISQSHRIFSHWHLYGYKVDWWDWQSGSRNRWCKAYEGFYYTVGKKKNRYGANVNERISDVTGWSKTDIYRWPTQPVIVFIRGKFA